MKQYQPEFVMRKLTQLAASALDRIQIRLTRARPGSVLILVVVLVVLLALIGTATLSTTQGDRYIAVQNSANTQADLIIEGVKEIAKSAILRDLYGVTPTGAKAEYRPAQGSGAAGTRTDYNNWDGYNLGFVHKKIQRAGSVVTVETRENHTFEVGDRVAVSGTRAFDGQGTVTVVPDATHFSFTQQGAGTTETIGVSAKIVDDVWLSPRLPNVYPNGSRPYPLWSHLGRLPGIANFDTPLTMKNRAGDVNAGVSSADLAIPTVYTDRVSYTPEMGDPVYLMPNYVYPESTGATGTSYPAFVVSDPRGLPFGRYVIAGDTDGDGQADAGLFKIPIGEVDGVTYYGAVRIIDNNSAVNVNTAWSRASDFNFSGQMVDALGDVVLQPSDVQMQNNLGIFPSHVGLLEMMNSGTLEMPALNAYLRNNVAVSATPIADTGVGTLVTATPRPDFQFVTQGDALAHQLARRTSNPGFVSGSTRYRGFGFSESTGLAYRFTLQNRDAVPTALEGLLRSAVGANVDSVFKSAGNFDANVTLPSALNSTRFAYATNNLGFARWFDDNFYLDAPTNSSFSMPGAQKGAIAPIPPNNPPAPPATVQLTRGPNYKRSIRSLLTSDNPISNQAPTKLLPNPLPAAGSAGSIVISGMANYRLPTPPATEGPIPKTNVNNAPFEELWRAYWCVMSENPAGTGTPFTTATDPAVDGIYLGMDFAVKPAPGTNNKVPANPSGLENPQRMFRSVVRDSKTSTDVNYFKSNDMVLLRSAAAAVQTLQLRDPKLNDLSVPAVHKTIKLKLYHGPAASASNDVVVTIFGTKPQPFITEIFAWTDISPNHKGPTGGGSNVVPYVAVELYNPYPFPITLDQRYRIAWGDRLNNPLTNWGTPYTPTTLYTFDGTKSIPPNGFIILDNSNAVSYLPPSVGSGSPFPSGVDRIAIPNLDQALNGEMLIIRDEASGTTDPSQMVAIDSYDFSGLIDGSTNKFYAWHYARQCGDGGDNRWRCVYPGRYRGNQAQLRQQGTDWTEWADNPAGNVPEVSPWDMNPGDLAYVLRVPDFGAPNTEGTFPGGPPIQLSNLDFGGPNKPVSGSGNKYPFGGFMRNGDILQVPFIAAYTIATDAGVLVDFNSVSMDASFAEDTDIADDYPDATPASLQAYPDVRESIGRFAPVVVATNSQTFSHNDLDPSGGYASGSIKWRYHWATRLFDYLTVQSPDSDYLPNAPNPTPTDPDGYQAVVGVAPVPVDNVDDDKKAGEQMPPNLTPPAEYNNEAGAGIEGLININTAPWKVLAAIPWVPTKSDKFGFDEVNRKFDSNANGRDDNEDIARAIVYWRDGNALATGDILPQGPFTSLYDLYRVRVPVSLSDPGVFVFDAVQKEMMNAADPDDAQGDFSPRNGNPMASGDTKDHARFDFEEQYMLLTKVGNLLTTRSDSFTVYIQVQGWRGVGTIKPELVVQRRTSFIIDRSKITREGGSADVVNVPNE